MFPDNNWYSHKEILKKYIKKNIKIFNASVQHGSITHTFDRKFGRIIFPFIKYLVWNKKALNVCKNNGFNNAEIIGAPFIYLNELMKKKKFVTNKNSYFIFIPHSGELGSSVKFDHKNFIIFAKKKFRGSLTACFFYKDINNNLIKLYKKNKIKIFSCGKRNNKKYLFSLYKQMRVHENIVVTLLGSPLFYSLYLNKKTFFVRDFTPLLTPKKFESQEKIYQNKHTFLYKNLANNYKVDPVKGKKIADDELGVKFLKDKSSLRKLLYSQNIFVKFYTEICKFLLYIKWKNKLIN